MSGAVELGPDVVCDGFLVDKTARVQTHVHSDHMSEFESSKGTQEIIASPETHAMLCTEHDADLPYRRNFVAVESGRSIEVGDCRVWTLRSGHMLGAVQVGVELDDGTCIGYSGDFQWPLAAPLEVEALIIDATYGSPASVREYTQDDAEAELVSLIARLLPAGPVSILAHRGTLQRALQLINGEVQCDVVGSERLIKEVGVYRQYGYPIGPVMSVTSPEGKQVMESGRYIRVYGSGDAKPVSGPGSSIRLSAYFTRPDAAVVEYSQIIPAGVRGWSWHWRLRNA